jgi:hypothetical protein
MSEVFPGTPEPAGVSRRSVLKAVTGGAALAVTPSLLLAACGSSSGGSTSTKTAAAAGAATGTITFGSNYSDPVPKAAFAAMIAGFTAKNSGAKVNINTVDHNTFQTLLFYFLSSSLFFSNTCFSHTHILNTQYSILKQKAISVSILHTRPSNSHVTPTLSVYLKHPQ